MSQQMSNEVWQGLVPLILGYNSYLTTLGKVGAEQHIGRSIGVWYSSFDKPGRGSFRSSNRICPRKGEYHHKNEDNKCTKEKT